MLGENRTENTTKMTDLKIKDQTSEVYLMDCMELMSRYPDKHFDLAVVDPPYGIGRDGSIKTTSKHGGRKAHAFKGWDTSIPKLEYFTELFRVSQNQIIWGANYFPQYLPSSMGWIFWDKGQRICNSDGELAFSSFQKALRVVTINRVQLQVEGETFHPTQKPIKLYDFCFDFAKLEAGAKVLDTHLGSGSSRISAKKNKLNFVACEIDAEYFEKSCKRYDDFVSQRRIF